MEQKTETDFLKRFDYLVKALFWVQAVMGALWAFQDPMPPLQDYPNHVANVFIMLKLHASPFFQHYYYLDLFPYPYLFQDFLLSLFMLIGGLDFAAKMFVALAMVTIPAGFYFLLKKISPDKLYLSYFALPLMWNKPLFKGNCNFTLGVALGFITLAFLWELLHSPKNRKVALGVAVGALLVFLTHLIAFYLFMFTVVILVVYQAWCRKDRKLLALLAAFVPAIIILLLNMGKTRGLYSNLNLMNEIFSWSNIQGKFSELLILPVCFSSEENRIMFPYWLGLLFLIVAGLPRLRSNPFPFILIGSLFVLYIFTPRQLQIMIRPHERVLVFTMFLLPLCCLNQRFLAIEKFFTVILCTVTFFQINDYFTKAAARVTPEMAEARALMDELPPNKRMMAIWAQWPGKGSVGYGQCMSAYYAMDREGYVSMLYEQQYTLIKHKNALKYSSNPNDLTPELIQPYDFLFVWGKDPRVESIMRESGFVPRKETPLMGVYEKRTVF